MFLAQTDRLLLAELLAAVDVPAIGRRESR